MQINLIWDPSTSAAPADFFNDVNAAAATLDALVTNPITVNITVGYGEDQGMSLGGAAGTGGPIAETFLTYTQYLQDYAANITSTAQETALANLPATDPEPGASIEVSGAVEKAWGLIPANGTEIDGGIGLSITDYGSYLPDALHELAHAMGRLAWLSPTVLTGLDLMRYVAPGVPELVGGQPAYFSIDGGVTNLDNFDTTEDYGDWSAAGPLDPFSIDGDGTLSATDTTELNAIGFAVASSTPPPATSIVSTASEFAGAIGLVNHGTAGQTYTINLAAGLPAGTLALTSDLPAIALPAGVTLDIEGVGQTIDGGGTAEGLIVASGNVAISDLTVAHTVSRGAPGQTGAGGGGGGAGVGGGLFVASGATVTLSGSAFIGDAAIGGDGGSVVNTDPGGNAGGPNGAQVSNGASLASQTGGGNGLDFQGGGGGANQFLSTSAGPGGIGGFGGGGGGAGDYQLAPFNRAGAGGFGAGAGGDTGAGYPQSTFGGSGGGGGGGMAAGGDIFVNPGGVLLLTSGELGAGTLAAGTGGAGGNIYASPGADGGNGSAFGTGIFLRGTTGLQLAPPPGQTLAIAGGIADQTGSGGTGANAGSAYVVAGGGGTVALEAASTYTGNTVLEDGVTLDVAVAGAVGSTGLVEFAGPATLQIAPGVPFSNVIDAVGAGDTIDLGGVANGASPASVAFNPASQILTVSGTTGGVTHLQLFSAGTDDPANFHSVLDAAGTGTSITYVACFATGTRIATPGGAAPVEQLRPGDLVRTASGAARPVQWLGHRRILTSRHPSPQDILPVRVAAGAFAPNRPGRDLLLSPDHAVFIAGGSGAPGVLIPIRYLANGRTIRQLRVPEITYWHVELATHDVLLAEGLPCESYLDTGNRAAFANAGPVTTLHPDFAPPAFAHHIWHTQGCAPLRTTGPRVVAARAALLRQADSLGHTQTTEAALRVLADGIQLPAHVRGRTWRLNVPPATKSLRIVTRSWVPNHTGAAATDTRTLGVALRNLRVDGIVLPLDDPRLSSGWHAIEGARTPGGPFRWTNGNAGLSLAGANGISFDVIMTGTYWQRAPTVGLRRQQNG